MTLSNGLLTIECDLIVHMSPQETRSCPTLSMDVRMTKPQMRAALEQFLEHVTQIEFEGWLEDLAPAVIRDAVKAAMEERTS